MSSILKVDQIQLSNGTTPTAADLGLDVAGSVIQTKHQVFNAHTTVSNTEAKFIELGITTTKANSKILAKIDYSTGHFGSYTDHDTGLAIGWKTGSVGSTTADYNTADGYAFSRQTFSNSLYGFMAADTHPAGTTGTQYWPFYGSVTRLISPSAASGTTIQVALWASTDGTLYLGRTGSSAGYTDSGMQSSITLLEIAG